jgi:uncharacterized lipoprotein YmbA
MNGRYDTGDVVLGKWTLTRLIGEGSCGKVFEARREDFGAAYRAAVKIITIPQNQRQSGVPHLPRRFDGAVL